MKSISNIISFVLHPMLMVTYGMIFALSFTYLNVFPSSVKWMIIGGTFTITAVAPALFIFLVMHYSGHVDLELNDRKERVIPYLIFISSLLICFYFQNQMKLPVWLLALFAGAAFALMIALLINFFWKISAHAIGIGCLLGSVMGISHIHLLNPYWIFMSLFLLAGAVCTARIYLKRHTPFQAYAGACLGFICTFTTSLLSYHYLFI